MKKRDNNGSDRSNGAPKKGWFGRHKKLVIVCVILILLCIVFGRACARAKHVGAMVTTIKAEVGDLQESISTSGSVEAQQVKVYFAPTAGTLAKINVEAGDAVKAGDVLMSYDVIDLESSYRQASLEQDKATASYEGAIADNSKNQTKLSEANRNLAILDQQIEDHKAYLKDLKEKLAQSQRDTENALSKESYELTRKLNELDKDDADYESKYKKIQKDISRNNYLQSIAKSSDYVVEMQAEIDRVQEFLTDRESYKAKMESQKSASESSVLDSYDKVRYEADKELSGMTYEKAQNAYNEVKDGIRAAFDGIVTSVDVVEGAGVPSGTKLLTLESSNDVIISFSASKQDVERLQIGQKADVTISGNVYTGSVSKINRMAVRTSSNAPMVGVQIKLDQPDDKIILGMDAKFTIYTRKAEKELLVPVEVINADKEGDFLYVVEDGHIAVKRVVCGITNDTYAVIEDGITEEDEIVQTYVGNIEEGTAVSVMPAVAKGENTAQQ